MVLPLVPVTPIHASCCRRMSIKTIRDLAELLRRDRPQPSSGMPISWPAAAVDRRRNGDGARTRGYRVGKVVESVAADALTRQEQEALRQLPAVARNARDRNCGASTKPCSRSARVGVVIGVRLACSSTHCRSPCLQHVPGSLAGIASGATASRRSDSDMTSAKTGAATSLP